MRRGVLVPQPAAAGAFRRSHRRAANRDFNIFIELSPHPLLLPAVEETFQKTGRSALTLPSGRRDEPQLPVLLQSLAAVYERGGDVRWDRLYPEPGNLFRCPTYPWQRERFWFETTPSVPAPSGGAGSWRRLSTATAREIFETELDLDRLPYLSDHRVHGAAVVPAAYWLYQAWQAGRQVFDGVNVELQHCEFREPLALSESVPVQLQLILKPRNSDSWAFSFHARRIMDGTGVGIARHRHDSQTAGGSTCHRAYRRWTILKRRIDSTKSRPGAAYRMVRRFEWSERFRWNAAGIAVELRSIADPSDVAWVSVIDGALQPFLLRAPNGTTCLPRSIERFALSEGLLADQPLVASVALSEGKTIEGGVAVTGCVRRGQGAAPKA